MTDRDRGALFIGVLLMPFTTITTAWVMSTLWGWFVVPTFGAPPLSVATAVGLGALAMVVQTHQTDPQQSTYDRLVGAFSTFFSKCSMGLLLGWIALQFTA